MSVAVKVDLGWEQGYVKVMVRIREKKEAMVHNGYLGGGSSLSPPIVAGYWIIWTWRSKSAFRFFVQASWRGFSKSRVTARQALGRAVGLGHDNEAPELYWYSLVGETG